MTGYLLAEVTAKCFHLIWFYKYSRIIIKCFQAEVLLVRGKYKNIHLTRLVAFIYIILLFFCIMFLPLK